MKIFFTCLQCWFRGLRKVGAIYPSTLGTKQGSQIRSKWGGLIKCWLRRYMSTFGTRQGVGTYAGKMTQVGLLGRMDFESAWSRASC